MIFVNHIFNFVDKNLLIACLLMFFLNSCVYLFSSIFVARTDAKTQTYFSIFNQVISLISALFFIILFQYQSFGIVLGQCIGSLVSLILFASKLKSNFSLDISKRMLWKILRFSLPLVPSSMGVIGMMYVDRIMLESFLGLREIGIYGISVRISAIALIFILALRQSITPLIYRDYNDPELPSKLALYLKVYIFLAVVTMLTSEYFGLIFIEIVFGSTYLAAFEPISILAFAFFISNAYMFYPGIVLKEKQYF